LQSKSVYFNRVYITTKLGKLKLPNIDFTCFSLIVLGSHDVVLARMSQCPKLQNHIFSRNAQTCILCKF